MKRLQVPGVKNENEIELFTKEGFNLTISQFIDL